MHIQIEIVMSKNGNPVVKMTGACGEHWEADKIRTAIQERVGAMQDYCNAAYKLKQLGVAVPEAEKESVELTKEQRAHILREFSAYDKMWGR